MGYLKDLKEFENFKIYEEISVDGRDSVVYASWTEEGISYITNGQGVCGQLYAWTLIDGDKNGIRLNSVIMKAVVDAIETYREKQYFNILKAELYKSYIKNANSYHFSDHNLFFCIQGKHLRYKVTPQKGLYEVLEEAIGGEEVSIGYKLLTKVEYQQMIKDNIKKEEAK